MYGLEAINQANGWAMSAAGAGIVLSGLSMLSFLISQLHRLTELLDSDSSLKGDGSLLQNQNVIDNVSMKLSGKMEEDCKVYMSLTDKLGDSFKLVELYGLSKKLDLPHPHLSIKNFRNSGFLVSLGNGLFSWKSMSG